MMAPLVGLVKLILVDEPLQIALALFVILNTGIGLTVIVAV